MLFNEKATAAAMAGASETLITTPVYEATPTMQPTMAPVDLSGVSSAGAADLTIIFLVMTIAMLAVRTMPF
jgi:hypothetical protein